MVEEARIDVTREGLFDTFLVCKVDKLAETYRLLYSHAQRLLRNDHLSKTMLELVKNCMPRVNDESCLERVLDYQKRTDQMTHENDQDEILKLAARFLFEFDPGNEWKSPMNAEGAYI